MVITHLLGLLGDSPSPRSCIMISWRFNLNGLMQHLLRWCVTRKRVARTMATGQTPNSFDLWMFIPPTQDMMLVLNGFDPSPCFKESALQHGRGPSAACCEVGHRASCPCWRCFLGSGWSYQAGGIRRVMPCPRAQPKDTLWLCQNSYGKSPFWMGKSTISMAIFNSYVSLPEGTGIHGSSITICDQWSVKVNNPSKKSCSKNRKKWKLTTVRHGFCWVSSPNGPKPLAWWLFDLIPLAKALICGCHLPLQGPNSYGDGSLAVPLGC